MISWIASNVSKRLFWLPLPLTNHLKIQWLKKQHFIWFWFCNLGRQQDRSFGLSHSSLLEAPRQLPWSGGLTRVRTCRWFPQGLNIISQTHIYPEPQNVALFGKGSLQMSLVKMRSCWSRGGPNPKLLVSLGEKKGTSRHTQGDAMWQQRQMGVMWLWARGTPRFSGNHEKLEEARNRCSLRTSRRLQPCQHTWLWICSLRSWNLTKIHSLSLSLFPCSLSIWVAGPLFLEAQGFETVKAEATRHLWDKPRAINSWIPLYSVA